MMRLFLALVLAMLPVAALGDSQSQLVNTGGSTYTLFPGGSSAGIQIRIVPGRLYKIINANVAAQTANMACYDSTSGAFGNILWQGVLPAAGAPGSVADVQIPTNVGLYCVPSGALAAGAGVLVTAN